MGRKSLLLVLAVLLTAQIPSRAQGAPPAVHVEASEDLTGFSIVSIEDLPGGTYQAECDAEGFSESLRLTAQGDEAVAFMELRYENGILVYGEAQHEQEPILAFDFSQDPPRGRWKTPQIQVLPSTEVLRRRSAMLRETGALLRERFGLKTFHGQAGHVAQLQLTGRKLVSVYFRTLGPQGGAYTFVDPASEDTVEVLTQDEYAYSWTVSIHKKRALIEKYAGAGLTTSKSTLEWEAGRWRGELVEMQPQYRRVTQTRLSSVQARQLLHEGGLVLGKVRERFKTQGFTIPLAQFGLP